MLKNLGLSILSGCLLALSWPEIGNFSWIIFLALVPLLVVENNIRNSSRKKKSLKIFSHAYLTFFLFNVITTWWIWFASEGGMVMAEVFNSLFMAILFWAYSLTKKILGNKVGYMSLIFYWMGFEWVHTNWELSWIWLHLGNVFANDVAIIQWYETTGIQGGSLWVLVLNILIFAIVKQKLIDKISPNKTLVGFTLLSLFLPIIYSSLRYSNYIEKEDPVDIICVQPNIDPYYEKFSGLTEHEQIKRLMQLITLKIDEEVDFVVAPETAFPLGYWEHDLDFIYGSERVWRLTDRFPKLRFNVGLSTMKLYVAGEETTPTARPFGDGSGNSFDYCNTAVQYDTSKNIQIYHKSKLVLGVEKMPFSGRFKFLEKLSIKLGGASGSLGAEKEAKVFGPTLPDHHSVSVAPLICYESIYGEYVTEFVKKGAGLLFIMTNDGWWKDTPGYRQHFAYARLRAIETRRSVARSANTGVSGFIDQRGDVLQKTGWWVDDVIRAKINANDHQTFYVTYGDYLGRIFAFFSLLIIAYAVVRSINKKGNSWRT